MNLDVPSAARRHEVRHGRCRWAILFRCGAMMPQASTRLFSRSSGPITGFVAISPAEINLKHQLSLIATIGRAFGNVTLYAGGGPALFGVETNFINGIPFAISSLSGTFPASLPSTVFNENWVWGGAAQVGATYAFAGGRFLDFAYTYARSSDAVERCFLDRIAARKR
jgi:hypothetical protein